MFRTTLVGRLFPKRGNRTLIVPTDKGPIMLTDHFHRDYLSIVADVVGTDVFKVVRNYLLRVLHIEYIRNSNILYAWIS
jgi:hypothetical protein